jgi:hypothetical protein
MPVAGQQPHTKAHYICAAKEPQIEMTNTLQQDTHITQACHTMASRIQPQNCAIVKPREGSVAGVVGEGTYHSSEK